MLHLTISSGNINYEIQKQIGELLPGGGNRTFMSVSVMKKAILMQ